MFFFFIPELKLFACQKVFSLYKKYTLGEGRKGNRRRLRSESILIFRLYLVRMPNSYMFDSVGAAVEPSVGVKI